MSLRGTIRVPGDKSLAHRALILAAMAEGVSQISNLPDSADVRSTIACLRALGVRIRSGRVWGVGGRLRKPKRTLDAGNSGTTARLLLGLLSGQPFACRLTGDASLRRRPMGRVAQPLRRMGARVELRDGDHLPARIQGGALRGIRYSSPVPSAQLKSAVLIAGLLAKGKTTVSEPLKSRDHTERLLSLFQGKKLKLRLPGDASSAAYWVVAALLVPGSRLRLPGVLANPTRTGFLRVLRRMGARIATTPPRGSPEPVFSITVESARLRAVRVRRREVPSLIDEIPVLTLAASQAEGTSRFEGLSELRHKESDRLSGTLRLLRAFGARAEVRGDDLLVTGPSPLRGCRFDPQGDHRLAMTAAVAGLIAQGRTTVAGSDCIAVSYPGFRAELSRHLA